MLKIVDHVPRYARGMRAGFTDDWHAQHGAEMDRLDGWQPMGCMRCYEVMPGTSCAYHFRSGMAAVRDVPPARRHAFPVVDGTRYRVVFLAGGTIDAKAEKPRARPLRQWSPAWRRVTDAGLQYLACM